MNKIENIKWKYRKVVFAISITVVIGDSVTSIGNWAFDGHSTLTSVTIGKSVTTIGGAAFYSCALDSITIPNGVTTIKSSAFSGCINLTSISIPNSVTTIEALAFSSCNKLPSITIPNGVKSIGEMTFMHCFSLTSVILPDSLTTIRTSAFYCCYLLDSVILPNSLTTIGDIAFAYCFALNNITIPKNVTKIEGGAFHNCTGLKSIIIQATTPPALGSLVFNNVSDTIPVYIPCGTYEAYSTNLYWRWAWGIYAVPIEFTNFIEPTIDTGFYLGSFCYGKTYSDTLFSGLTDAGQYYTTIQTANGCDSVVCLTLTAYPEISVYNYSAAFRQGETYSDANFINLVAEGKYCNTLQTVDGCDSVVCLTLTYDKTGIKQLTMHNAQLITYPNPTTNQLRITNCELWNGEVEYSIYSVAGQMVMHGTLQSETSVINLAPLANGMYFLWVGEKTVKVVKE